MIYKYTHTNNIYTQVHTHTVVLCGRVCEKRQKLKIRIQCSQLNSKWHLTLRTKYGHHTNGGTKTTETVIPCIVQNTYLQY